MRAQFVLAALILVQTLGARAAESVEEPVPSQIAAFQMSDVYDAQAASEILATWAKGERKLASSQSFGENDLSPSMKMIRAKYLAAKTPDDLAARIDELQAGYDGLSDDAKFFAAQMIMLKPLRGIVWRLRPLFEQGKGLLSFSGNPATHSAAVTALRMMNRVADIYVPTQQADVLTKYMVAPSAQMRLAQQFKTVAQFQTYLATELVPAEIAASRRIGQLFKKSTKMPFVWDNKMMYGAASFQDGVRRYVGFGEPEVALTQAAILKSLHATCVFLAYNQDELMNVAGKLGKFYGTDGYASEDLGVTSAERTQILKSFRAKNFLSLRNPTYMSAAYKFLVASSTYANKAYEILRNQPASTAMIINPLFFKSDAQPRLADGIGDLVESTTKRMTARNLVTGETVEVDVPGFYAKPPKSLLDLLPTAFVQTQSHEITITNTAGEKLKYRDYNEGSPTAWNAAEWRTLFPGLKNDGAVDDALRNVQYSGGPAIVIGGMRGFIF